MTGKTHVTPITVISRRTVIDGRIVTLQKLPPARYNRHMQTTFPNFSRNLAVAGNFGAGMRRRGKLPKLCRPRRPSDLLKVCRSRGRYRF
jgi:hypothetical protein